MLKDLYELQDQQIGLNLGKKVDKSIEFDLQGHSIEIFVPQDLLIDGSYIRVYVSVPISKLPVRIESNGSWLITLKEIEGHLIKTYNEEHFTLNYEEARSGGVFHFNNYGENEWTLHGITKGYS